MTAFFLKDNNEASVELYIIIFSLHISAVYLLQMFGNVLFSEPAVINWLVFVWFPVNWMRSKLTFGTFQKLPEGWTNETSKGFLLIFVSLL